MFVLCALQSAHSESNDLKVQERSCPETDTFWVMKLHKSSRCSIHFILSYRWKGAGHKLAVIWKRIRYDSWQIVLKWKPAAKTKYVLPPKKLQRCNQHIMMRSKAKGVISFDISMTTQEVYLGGALHPYVCKWGGGAGPHLFIKNFALTRLI